MKSVIKVTLVILARWVFMDPAAGLSQNVLDFVTLFCVTVDNSAQINVGVKGIGLAHSTVVPVSVPLFNGNAACYFEESYNGHIARTQLLEVTEDKDGMIEMTPHNFTDPTKYRAGHFLFHDLSNLKPEDLQPPKTDCDIYFRPETKTVYIGRWTDCKHQLNGEYLFYTLTLSCYGFTFSSPVTAEEKTTKVEFEMRAVEERVKIPGAPDDYIGPCDQKPYEDTSSRNFLFTKM